MIKNVVFDIGNVLSDFRYKEFLRDKGFDDAMIKRISKASVECPAWMEYDKGALTDEELMALFVENDPALEAEFHIAYDDIKDMVVPRAYAIPWVQALKAAGYGVYYLSNYSRKATAECADALEFIQYTDGGILSYREKMIKPFPEIYRLLLERYNLKAGETVFIDDTPANITTAKNEGWEGIVFKTYQQTCEELNSMGVIW